MVYFFFGQNSYQIRHELDKFISTPNKTLGQNAIERVDGESLNPEKLTELLQGATLFAPERLVIIREASKNKPVWEALGEKLTDIPDSLRLIVVEPSPDKRTKTFKALQKHAESREFKDIEEHDAVKWLVSEAKSRGGEITKADAEFLVSRVGTEAGQDRVHRSEQMRLSNELDKLLLYGSTDKVAIEKLVERTPQENAFALLDASMNGNLKKVRELLDDAKITEDAYRLFGLLSMQVLQLAALVYADGRTPEAIAKELGTHPYPVRKLAPLAKNVSRNELKIIVEALGVLDDQMKSTGIEPWLLLENALIKIAAR